MTTSVEPASGYRELARVPGLGGIMAGIYLSRTATAMMATALTLLALDRYDSATIGGAAVFAAMLPGLVVSPLAGALLDRHGRVRLVVLDYCVAAATMGVVAALAVADVLAPWMLIGLAGTASLTTPLPQRSDLHNQLTACRDGLVPPVRMVIAASRHLETAAEHATAAHLLAGRLPVDTPNRDHLRDETLTLGHSVLVNRKLTDAVKDEVVQGIGANNYPDDTPREFLAQADHTAKHIDTALRLLDLSGDIASRNAIQHRQRRMRPEHRLTPPPPRDVSHNRSV